MMAEVEVGVESKQSLFLLQRPKHIQSLSEVGALPDLPVPERTVVRAGIQFSTVPLRTGADMALHQMATQTIRLLVGVAGVRGMATAPPSLQQVVRVLLAREIMAVAV